MSQAEEETGGQQGVVLSFGSHGEYSQSVLSLGDTLELGDTFDLVIEPRIAPGSEVHGL